MKLDKNGNIDWSKTFGGSGNDAALSVEQTTDGGYIIAGYTTSSDGDVKNNHGGSDVWVVKLDKNGNIDWSKTFGGSSDDQAFSVEQTFDNGYIIAGWTNSVDGDVKNKKHENYDYWILKLSSDGDLNWQETIGGDGDDKATVADEISEEEYIVVGFSNSENGDVSGNHGDYDVWVADLE